MGPASWYDYTSSCFYHPAVGTATTSDDQRHWNLLWINFKRKDQTLATATLLQAMHVATAKPNCLSHCQQFGPSKGQATICLGAGSKCDTKWCLLLCEYHGMVITPCRYLLPKHGMVFCSHSTKESNQKTRDGVGWMFSSCRFTGWWVDNGKRL